jgi:hypothetical protein
MPAWSEPQDLKTLDDAGAELPGHSAVALAVLAILISELRFSWVEVLVGRYLAVTNTHRPESGSVWEQGRLETGGHPDPGANGDPQLTAQREAREANFAGPIDRRAFCVPGDHDFRGPVQNPLQPDPRSGRLDPFFTHSHAAHQRRKKLGPGIYGAGKWTRWGSTCWIAATMYSATPP